MIDWKNTFDIVFVASSLALIVFLFASVTAVVAKGKRRRNAFDIILRIISSLVLVASTVLLLCVILTVMPTESGFYIGIGELADEAFLVMGGDATALPMPRLFIILSTSLGAIIAFGLFILSLIAVIADCRLANVKSDGADKKRRDKPAKAKRTAEDIKREAELAKIKRLADAAVKKTSAAADRAPAEKNSPESDEANVAKEESAEDDFDWRVQSAQSESRDEFVGLSDNSDDAFDTFDDVTESDSADVDPDPSEARTRAYEERARESYGEAVSDVDELTDEAQTDGETDESAGEAAEEEYAERNGHEDGEAYAQTEYGSEASDGEAAEEEYADTDGRETRDDSFGGYADDDEFTATGDELEDYLDGNVEPDRDIYIPKVRTIVKPAERVAARPEKRTSAKSEKQAAKASNKQAVGRTAKQPAGARKKPTADGKANGTVENKRLPVNRRYVIIDRHSAVNMFGKYLKERDGESKNKLESSINTIIIK